MTVLPFPMVPIFSGLIIRVHHLIRRSQATKIYANKILEGYKMSETLCEKCDMPMCEKYNVMACVFCRDNEETLDKEVFDSKGQTEDQGTTGAEELAEKIKATQICGTGEIIVEPPKYQNKVEVVCFVYYPGMGSNCFPNRYS